MSDNAVEQYGWNTPEGPDSCNYLAPKILEMLKGLPVKRVLDLGCGNGALCGTLASAGFDVAGVEYDADAVEIAKAAHPGINFHRFGVQDNPAVLLEAEKAFDAVVSTEVVEHLFSPHLLPRYAIGVLKPGGFLIISTPYHGYLKNMALSVLDGWDTHHTPLWHGGHIKFWSRKTLTSLLQGNGFKVVGFSGVGRLPYLWKSMILTAQKA